MFSAQKNSRSRKQEASADYLPTYFKVFGEVKVEGSNRRVVLVPEVDSVGRKEGGNKTYFLFGILNRLTCNRSYSASAADNAGVVLFKFILIIIVFFFASIFSLCLCCMVLINFTQTCCYYPPMSHLDDQNIIILPRVTGKLY